MPQRLTAITVMDQLLEVEGEWGKIRFPPLAGACGLYPSVELLRSKFVPGSSSVSGCDGAGARRLAKLVIVARLLLWQEVASVLGVFQSVDSLILKESKKSR